MYKKNLLSVLLIICMVVGLTAQVNYTHTLKGRITYLSSGYRPVVGAQVIAEGATPTRTDADGRFTLVFYRREAGVDVQLNVTLNKLVVVNEKELMVTLKKDETKEINLYLCEQVELDNLRALYYDVSIKNITRRFEEESERLRLANQLSTETIARLESEKQAFMEQARELAERFARVNFDDISALHRKALEYFKAGDIKKANETLNLETITGNIDKANEQKRQGIAALLFKAEMCKLDFQFELARQCYEAALARDMGNSDVIF